MNKVATIDQAMEHVTGGMTIMIGGFMSVGTPEKLMDAIIAKGISNLTVVCNDAGLPGRGASKLIEARRVKKYFASHVGLTPEFGRQMSSGELDATLVPQGTLAERIRGRGRRSGRFPSLLPEWAH